MELNRKGRRKINKEVLKQNKKYEKLNLNRKFIDKLELINNIEFSFIANPIVALDEIKKDTGRIRHVSESAMSSEVIEYAIKENGLCLQYIRGKKQTESACIIAVSQNHESFLFVEERNRTKNVRLACVKRYGDSIKWMNKDEQDEEICLAAINQKLESSGSHDAFFYIHEERQTENVIIAALNKDFHRFINKISEKNFTDKIVKYILNLKIDLIVFLNQSVISDSNYLHYINQGGSIKEIPINRLNDELIDTAIKKNGYDIQYIEPIKRTQKRCFDAINSKPDSIRYVPIEIRTFEMYLFCCRENAFCLQYVHREDWFNLIKHSLNI